MNKERRLGRGLEALLGRPVGAPSDATVAYAPPSDAAPPAVPVAGLLQLNVHDIDRNPFQPRQEFDEASIEELAASLREHGLIQPLIVRRLGDRYQLVAGERGLRAAIHAGWSEVPVQLRETDDRQMAEIAIVENLQRKDLNPLEKAASFQQYVDRYQCKHEELAARLGIDRSTISNLIRLLELPELIQSAIRNGTISQGHARALLPLGDEREQLAVCRRIFEETLSVRATEEIVQELIRQADTAPLGVVTPEGERTRPKRTHSAQLASLEQELRGTLGAKVVIKQKTGGRGQIVIHFSSSHEFERLRTLLAGYESGDERTVI